MRSLAAAGAGPGAPQLSLNDAHAHARLHARGAARPGDWRDLPRGPGGAGASGAGFDAFADDDDGGGGAEGGGYDSVYGYAEGGGLSAGAQGREGAGADEDEDGYVVGGGGAEGEVDSAELQDWVSEDGGFGEGEGADAAGVGVGEGSSSLAPASASAPAPALPSASLSSSSSSSALSLSLIPVIATTLTGLLRQPRLVVAGAGAPPRALLARASSSRLRSRPGIGAGMEPSLDDVAVAGAFHAPPPPLPPAAAPAGRALGLSDAGDLDAIAAHESIAAFLRCGLE